MRQESLKTVFVETMPEVLEEGLLYVSEMYSVTMHKCPCGCGSEIVVPTSGPLGWTITRKQDLITLWPSIGNFYLPCKSHYWIRDNKVVWA